MWQSSRICSGIGIALLGALIACGGRAEVPAGRIEPTVSTVDGVRVVDNHAPSWPDGEGWRLSAEPLLALGVDAGRPSEMFTYPTAIRLDNGTIVVADRGAAELRAFDAEGGHMWTAGRRGQGPGEFEYLADVFATSGNKILAYDRSRITVFGPDGALVDTFEPAAQPDERFYPNTRIQGVFSDGSLLGTAGLRFSRETGGWPGIGAGERGWTSSAVIRYAPDAQQPERLAELDTYEVGQSEGWPVPFQAFGFVHPHSNGFYYVNGRRPYIEDRGPDGGLRTRFRNPLQPVPVTPDARDRWLHKSLANYEEAGYELDPERRDGMVFPETMPLRRDLMVDSEDNAWTERFLGLQHSRPLHWGIDVNPDPFFPVTESVWDVFDADGIWLGGVDLLPGRTVHQIGSDWLLMSGEDEAGVHRVWLYALIKP